MQRSSSNDFTFGDYTVRSDEQIVYFRGRPVALAPKVVTTFTAFLREPGRVVSKAELMDRIWPDEFVEDANLTQNIYVLRKMFEEHGSGVRIENLPKRGYRLVSATAAVRCVPMAPQRSRSGLMLRSLIVSAAVTVAAAAAILVLARPSHRTGSFSLPPAAMQQYLLAQHELKEGNRPALVRSAQGFASVMREAPNSALGYAGLSESNTSLTFFSDTAAERAHHSALAVSFAKRAVEVDGRAAEAYAALGAAETSIELDPRAATQSFEAALRLDPRNLDALIWYGTAFLNAGRAAEARTLFRRALAVDPSVPGSVASLAWADFLLRDYADAAAFSRQLILAHHLETMARLTLATADVQRRDFADARQEIAALMRSPQSRTQALALSSQVDAMLGHTDAALSRLHVLEARTGPDAVTSWDILAVAAAYARLRMPDAAFVWLERVQASERAQLARDPRFDELRRDKRFADWINA